MHPHHPDAAAATPTPTTVIAPGITMLALPLPGGTPPYSLCYLLEDSGGGIHVIDPGSDTAQNRELLLAALRALGADPAAIRTVTATHLHPDHLGLAAFILDRSPARLLLHPAESAALATLADPGYAAARRAEIAGWGIPAGHAAFPGLEEIFRGIPQVPAADPLRDGEYLPIPGRRVRVIHTPGHTPGHICLVEEGAGLVFTGDHVLPGINPGIGLGGPTPENPLAAYLDSLGRLAALGDPLVCPGHEAPFRGLARRGAALAEHHRGRTRAVAAALREAPGASVWQIASRLPWSGGWENLPAASRLSALAQTAMHRDFLAR